jgi:hypothetical protein
MKIFNGKVNFSASYYGMCGRSLEPELVKLFLIWILKLAGANRFRIPYGVGHDVM